MPHLLLIESEPDQSALRAGILERAGYRVTRGRVPERFGKAALAGFDAVLVDAETFQRTGARCGLPLIVLDEDANIERAVRAMKRGAAEYLAVPTGARALLACVDEALSHAGTARGADAPAAPSAPRGNRPPFPMIGACPVMRDLQQRIEEVAPTDATVLIEGELGTGKELVARALHAASARSFAPLITVNCAAIPDALVEQELFGYGDLAGDHTGGLLEAAEGGTLFLDEVGELPLAAQARLASCLTSPSEPSRPAQAGTQPDVRFMAASHLDLQRLRDNGRFRNDLYDRLNPVSLTIPPLRDREQDVLQLADSILAHSCEQLGKRSPRLTAEARATIAAYRWPGNVRELDNIIERAALLCEGEVIDADLLAIDAGAKEDAEETRLEAEPVSLEEYFVRFVREHQDQLTETELAEQLGISRKSLWERRQRLGIPRKKTLKRGPRRS